MGLELSAFKTDPEKDKNGVWFDIRDGLKLKVARLGNERYQRKIRELTMSTLR